MSNSGSQYYDNDSFFQEYMTRREKTDNANDTLEKPVIDELLGDVSNLTLLDLGCGDARYAQELIKKGCSSIIGVEGSINMYKQAYERTGHLANIEIFHSNIEQWTSHLKHSI